MAGRQEFIRVLGFAARLSRLQRKSRNPMSQITDWVVIIALVTQNLPHRR
jgi:hypothetical protein